MHRSRSISFCVASFLRVLSTTIAIAVSSSASLGQANSMERTTFSERSPDQIVSDQEVMPLDAFGYLGGLFEARFYQPHSTTDDPRDEIREAASLYGLDLAMMMSIAKVESNFDPRARTGSYKGIFQLSDYEFKKYGDGSIWDARDNARAAAHMLLVQAEKFRWALGHPQSGHRRHDRQRARVVRFRRLRLLRHDDVAALLPRRRQDHIAAQGLCRLRRRLRHVAGRLGPIRHLWRSIWQTPGPECGHFSHGIFNRGNRAAADLRPSRGARTHSARGLQALTGAVRRRRVGRIDLLHRGIRTGRTARIHRLLAAGQRRLGLPAWFPERRAPPLGPFTRSVHFLGM